MKKVLLAVAACSMVGSAWAYSSAKDAGDAAGKLMNKWKWLEAAPVFEEAMNLETNAQKKASYAMSAQRCWMNAKEKDKALTLCRKAAGIYESLGQWREAVWPYSVLEDAAKIDEMHERQLADPKITTGRVADVKLSWAGCCEKRKDFVKMRTLVDEILALPDEADRYMRTKKGNALAKMVTLYQSEHQTDLAIETKLRTMDYLPTNQWRQVICDVAGMKYERAWKETPRRDRMEAMDWLEGQIRDAKYAWSEKDRDELWSNYAYKAHQLFRQDLVEKAKAEIDAHGGTYGCYAGRWVAACKIYRDFATFPKDEREIVFPQTLGDLGVKEGKTVHAKDFGWDPQHATAALQAAIDSGASTVVVDDMGSPWYVRFVNVTNKNGLAVVFKKGVKVLCDEETKRENKAYAAMFDVKDCENLVFAGETGNAEDVTIGEYANYDERRKLCHDYGISAFSLVGTTNVVLRGMKLAECGMDGLVTGGLKCIVTRTWLENLVLNSNQRQAMSICNGDELYCRNVTFSNTRALAPAAGIDFEPPIECNPDSSVYLFDCTFRGNLGGGLLFSTSSYYPISCYAKRCKFFPNETGSLFIAPRLSIYGMAGAKAPAKIVLEDCDFEAYSDCSPVVLDSVPLFDVELINCRLRDTKRQRWPHRTPDYAPIQYHLSRTFTDFPPEKYGTLTLKNVTIDGFETSEGPIGFYDYVGTIPVPHIRGDVTFNGRKIDVSRLAYEPPDLAWKEVRVPAELAGLTRATTNVYETAELRLTCESPWWYARPEYGVYGAGEAFQCDIAAKGDRMARIRNPKDLNGYTGAFRVPGKSWLLGSAPDCMIKVVGGSFELRNAKGALVDACTEGKYKGAYYFRFKSASGQDETWTFRILSKGNCTAFKFFEPLDGVWRTVRGASFSTIGGDDILRSLTDDEKSFFAEMLADPEKAKDGVWAREYAKQAARVEEMKRTANSEIAAREASDESRNIQPLKRKADIEAAILKRLMTNGTVK